MSPQEHSARNCPLAIGQGVTVEGSDANWTVEMIGWFGNNIFVSKDGEGRQHSRWVPIGLITTQKEVTV